MDFTSVVGQSVIAAIPASAIIFGLSGFLRRVWAKRIGEKEAQKHRVDIQQLESSLTLLIQTRQAGTDAESWRTL